MLNDTRTDGQTRKKIVSKDVKSQLLLIVVNVELWDCSEELILKFYSA